MSRTKTSLLNKVHHKYSVFKRKLNSGNRILPDFLIIGAAKSGTTSLFHYLTQHPRIIKPFKKEIHFFDKHFNKGVNWYKLHFPTKNEVNIGQNQAITGEATPYYISHPLVPSRVKMILPKVKIIVLLRNPVDRAFSNYNHMVRMGFEKESFENAIDLESERTLGELDKIVNDNLNYSFKHHHYSYLSRSIYHIELERWLQYFNIDRFLFINSEDLYTNPSEIFTQTTNFLDLEKYDNIKYKKMNSGGEYMQMNDQTRIRLINFFNPHNAKLFNLIGKVYDWNS